MKIHHLTCIECPIGCELEVGEENGIAVYVKGNSCPRGKEYGENEVICPRRVLTSTVRLTNGKMLSVKTDKPVKKSELFVLMKKINAVTHATPVKIGDVVLENITENVHLIATDNVD